MNTTNDDERVISRALADALEALGKDTGGAIAALRRRAVRQRRMLTALIVIAAVTALTLAITITSLIGVRSATADLEDVQRRTSDAALCPLYGIFIQSAKNPPPPHYNDAQKAQRLEAIKVIEQGSRTLGCNFGGK